MERSFFLIQSTVLRDRLIKAKCLIYRDLQIYLLTTKTIRSMKKVLNVISIASNVAIILGRVTDTYFRVKGARQKKPTVTDLENDEV